MSPSPRSPRAARTGTFRAAFALLVSFLALFAAPSASLAADTAAPVITSSSVTPTWINVTGSSQTVTVTFHVTDESGLRTFPVVTATSDLSKQKSAPVTATLLSGTPLNGTFQAKLTVAKSAVGGGWTISAAQLIDHPGNQTAGAVVLGHFTVFAFGWDTVAPKLVDSSIAPTTVDTAGAPATIKISLHVTDDYSGTRTPVLTVTAADATQPSAGGTTTLESGDKNDGVWTLVATLPKGTPNGDWTVRLMPLTDESGNNSGIFTTIGTITVKNGAVTTGGGSGGGSGGTTTTTTTSTTSTTSTGTTTTVTKPAGTGDQGGVKGTSARSKSYLSLVTKSKSIKVSKTGTLTLAIHCTGFTGCRGSVKLYAKIKGKKVKIVSRRVSVKVGKTLKVTFKLTKLGRKFVARGVKYKTTVSIWTDGIAKPRIKSLAVKRSL